MENIADLLNRNAEKTEAIPVERLKEIFGEPPIGFGEWSYTPRSMFLSMWLAYERDWKMVIKAWGKGDYSLLRPTVPFPTGLLFFIIEGQTGNVTVEADQYLGVSVLKSGICVFVR